MSGLHYGPHLRADVGFNGLLGFTCASFQGYIVTKYREPPIWVRHSGPTQNPWSLWSFDDSLCEPSQ